MLLVFKQKCLSTRVNKEQSLDLTKEEICIISDSIRDFILIISPEKEIVEVNEAFLKHMKYAREEVVGKKCYDVFKEAIRRNSNCNDICPLKAVIKNQRAHRTELTRYGGDDLPRDMEVIVFPVWEKPGKILRFIEVSHDITKKKRDKNAITRRLENMVEERTRQLKVTHEKLLHQDKMASLGKLSSSVVHEINNPITGILNLLMLSKRILEEEEIISPKDQVLFIKYIDLMESETRRISRIVSNLLIFARQSKAQFKKLNMNRLIEQTLLLNSNLLKISNVKVKKELSIDLPELLASEDQLQQVFMNLVSNAAESMSASKSKQLTVFTNYSPREDGITICFQDTGTGIPKENIPKLFEPFYTTKKKGKGVGLGLSVAYGIIEEHGGSIFVDSELGRGTIFKIFIPMELSSPLDTNGTEEDPVIS